MFLKQNKDLAIILGVLLLAVFLPKVSHAQPPSAIQIKNELEQKPLWEHGDLYKSMLDDTSTLEHPALRKQLIMTAKKWHKKLIRGQGRGFNPGFTDEVMINNRVVWIFKDFRKIASKMEGQDAAKIWLNILPASPTSEAEEDGIQILKSNSQIVLRKTFEKIEYYSSGESQDENVRRHENRVIMSGFTFPRVLYEVVREHREELSPGFQNRIKRFSLEVIKRNKKDIPGLKMFGLATLLDMGFSKNELKKKYQYPDVEASDGSIIPGSFIKKKQLETVQEWRSEYPKWPTDESDVDNDRHKNDRGEGHDTQKGKGH